MSGVAQAVEVRATGRSSALLAVFAGMLLLCWPALLNGGVFYFPDTTTYLRSADTILGELTGWESAWSDRRKLYIEAPLAPAAAAATPAPRLEAQSAPAASQGPLHPVLLGRSIYYGLTVFPFVALFGGIAGALVQAAFAQLTIWLTLLAFGVDRSRMPARLLLTTALLAGLTSLPFFVSILMPDVFAGFAIALAVSSVAGWRRLLSWERVCLAGLLIFSGMVHSSHVLLLVALTGVTLLVTLLWRFKAAPALALMVAAAAAGILGEQLFIQAVTYRLGEPPVRPPFLTARLINDGPGYRLLKERCPAIELEACHYVDRMPQDSDTFLWSLDPREGVFSAESIPMQRRLAQQDTRFAIDTLTFDPPGVVAASARNIVRQAALTDLNIFNQANAAGGIATWDTPPAVASEIRASRYGRQIMPVAASRWANVVTAIAAALFLVAVLLGRTRERGRSAVRIAAALFLAAVALNATVTGAMSKPHDRYNVRVMWVLQLAALAILVARPHRKDLEQD